MLTDSNFLFFNDLHKVVICCTCSVNVEFKHLSVYLINYYEKTLTLKVKREFAAFISVNQAINSQNSSFIQKAEQQSYSIYLLIIVNDYHCLSTQCLYCCSSLIMMKQHVISMHFTFNLKNSPLYKHSAAILIIFLFSYMHYFKINLSASESKADSSIKVKFKTAQLKLNDYHHECHLALMQASVI